MNSFVKRLWIDLHDQPVLAVVSALVTVIVSGAMYIGNERLTEIQTDIAGLKCDILSTELSVRRDSLMDDLLVIDMDNIRSPTPLLTVVNSLSKNKLYQESNCNNVKEDLDLISAIGQGVDLYSRAEYEDAEDVFKKISRPILRDRYLSGIYNNLSKKDVFNDKRKKDYHTKSIRRAKSAYDSARISLISPIKTQILTKLECTWLGLTQQWQDVRDCLARVLRFREDRLAYLNLTIVEAQLGNLKQALTYFRRYLDTDPPQCKHDIDSDLDFDPLRNSPNFAPSFDKLVDELEC